MSRGLPKTVGKANPAANPAANPITGTQSRPGMVQCGKCKKFFQPARIAKHELICNTESRPKFDAAKHRVQGTQLEKYYNKRSPA